MLIVALKFVANVESSAARLIALISLVSVLSSLLRPKEPLLEVRLAYISEKSLEMTMPPPMELARLSSPYLSSATKESQFEFSSIEP